MNEEIHIKEVFEAYDYKLYKASEYKVLWKSCYDGRSIEMRPANDIQIQIIYDIDNAMVHVIHVILETRNPKEARLLWLAHEMKDDFLEEFKDDHDSLLHTKKEIFDLVTLKLKNG